MLAFILLSTLKELFLVIALIYVACMKQHVGSTPVASAIAIDCRLSSLNIFPKVIIHFPAHLSLTSCHFFSKCKMYKDYKYPLTTAEMPLLTLKQ